MSNPLPVVPLATAEVDVAGTTITVRRLSRSEALKLSTQFTKDTADRAEAFMVACGVGVSEAEAAEWLGSVDVDTAGIVIDKIAELSGLSPNIGKDGKPADPKRSGSGRS